MSYKIIQYLELNTPPLRTFAEFELVKNPLPFGSTSRPFLHSQLKGDSYSNVYHFNGTTIIVKQTEIKQAGDPEIKTGFGGRIFVFAGEEEGIEDIVSQLQSQNLKLEKKTQNGNR